jgi:hypothetical protein
VDEVVPRQLPEGSGVFSETRTYAIEASILSGVGITPLPPIKGLDKAAYLTALLAFGSLLAGSITGIIVQSITGMGFATGLVAFVQAASKSDGVRSKSLHST